MVKIGAKKNIFSCLDFVSIFSWIWIGGAGFGWKINENQLKSMKNQQKSIKNQ